MEQEFSKSDARFISDEEQDASGINFNNESSNRIKLFHPINLIYFLVFALTFSLPVYLGVYFVSRSSEDTGESTVNQFFPNFFRIPGPGNYLVLPNGQLTNPRKDLDFVASVWFNADRPLSQEDRTTILSKVSYDSPAKEGYILALKASGETITPQIYWRSAGGKGGWYEFSEFRMLAKQWYMLAITFRQGKYLGLHALLAPLDGDKAEIKLLGGYELDPPVVPNSSEALQIGGLDNSKFRGKLGAFGIFHTRNLKKDFNEILKDWRDSPSELPSDLEDTKEQIWITNFQDVGKFGAKIIKKRK